MLGLKTLHWSVPLKTLSLHRTAVPRHISHANRPMAMPLQQVNGLSSIPSSLAISTTEDDPDVRTRYRPFLSSTSSTSEDWIEKLELTSIESMVRESLENDPSKRLRVLVLYGSLRARSFSKALAHECARILFRLGCDVRVFNPAGLPVKDDVGDQHPMVQELRKLSEWSEGHVWVSPEQHGNVTAVFKNQIDWIPLSTGSVRPTQGRTLAIAQVSGGSQSFNTVNTLRILGRWMRMFTIPNQSSVPKAYTQFMPDAEGVDRMIASSNRDRVVDCMEEFVKFTLIMRPHLRLFDDRYSERLAKPLPPSNGHKQDPKNGSAVNGVDLKAL